MPCPLSSDYPPFLPLRKVVKKSTRFFRGHIPYQGGGDQPPSRYKSRIFYLMSSGRTHIKQVGFLVVGSLSATPPPPTTLVVHIFFIIFLSCMSSFSCWVVLNDIMNNFLPPSSLTPRDISFQKMIFSSLPNQIEGHE